ncbi:MAG: hypothetical protein ABI675_10605 [Chitinophagaceae bacterium]
MPRTIFFICSGVCLLNTTFINSQSLPKNPTPRQVVGYRITEQQRWNAQQLPKNSVLYKTDRKYPGWQSLQFNFKKEKQPVIDLSSLRSVPLPGDELINSFSSQQLPFLKANLLHQKQLYSQWQKQNWQKDVQGSMLLREFLIQSKSSSSFHL